MTLDPWCKLSVDVFAHWGSNPPRYRIYIDDELFTERDFIWPGHSHFIREHLEAELMPGTHIIRIESLVVNSGVELKNLGLDRKGTAIKETPLQIDFQIL